ncbi:MAG: DNA primase [Phycisphaerales bacterium]|nr:DNA primase [Phycisphaerales bacterium]MCB9858603.1 DNA primase [Phycisphaerales bacterium]
MTTTTNAMPYGFRVVGNATEARRLTNWAAAFEAHAACDDRAELDRQSFLSIYRFGDDFREHLKRFDSPKGYRGSCFADWIWIDIDREGDLRRALDDTRRLVVGIAERYGIDTDALLTFFSGGKGYHVGIPSALWTPEPSDRHSETCKRFAVSLAERLGIEIDRTVFDRQRLFRAPNSRHPKTSLHKRRLSADELLHLSPDAIRQLAEAPDAFEIPTRAARSEQAAADWRDAAETIERARTAKSERRRQGATLNRNTLDFIRDGATPGERHARLFSAAANLAEFDCTPELAHALLTESGLDCGLSPSDVRRQIDCGLNYDGGNEQ